MVAPGAVHESSFKEAVALPAAAARTSLRATARPEDALPAFDIAAAGCAGLYHSSDAPLIVRSTQPLTSDVHVVARDVQLPLAPTLNCAYTAALSCRSVDALDSIIRLQEVCDSSVSAKYDAVKAIVARASRCNESVVIFVLRLDTLSTVVRFITDAFPAVRVVSYFGSMTSDARDAALVRAQGAMSVMVVSLLAGGAGVDFKHANHAVLFSPSW